MTPRYLIIGASGLVGAHLYGLLGRSQAAATYNTRPVEGGVAFNATRDRLGDSVLKKHKDLTHAFIFHGVTGIDACARDPEGTAKINVASVKTVINELRDHGVTPVFASSDAVFDGSRGSWTETDETNPILTYGRHKVAVEQYLMRGPGPYLIVRFSKVLTSAPGHGDVLWAWMDAIDRDAEIRCARDQVFSPVNVEDLARTLVDLVEAGSTGVFHIGGPQSVSRLGLLGILVEEVRAFRDVSPRIVACSIRDFGFAEPRPLDTSLSSAKLYALLGRRLAGLEAVCRAAAAKRYGEPALARS